MAKLPTCYQGPANDADIIQLLHDEVVSLCQKNYNTVSGLEIDGIICISILDTKEQQVVKIHKTLKSVFADGRKKAKKQKTHEQPSCWLRGNSGTSGLSSDSNGNTKQNFQNDINALSNLLRDTNAAICRDLEEKTGEETVSKQSKRKRKQPKQRVTNNIESGSDKNETESTALRNIDNVQMAEENSVANSPGINPFIHKDLIKVKEEKIDPDYEAAEQTQPKIVNVSSLVSESDKFNYEPPENVVEQTKVSSIIDRLIEKEIPIDRSQDIKDNDQNRESSDSKVETEACNGDDYGVVEVKVEKNVDESEYGGSQYDQEENIGASSDNVGTGGSDSDTENTDSQSNWYNEHASLGSTGRNALLDKLQEKGTLALKGYPREVGREESDPQGRSWIEMVKDNVNKYQAALERSNKARSEIENDTNKTVSNAGTVQTSQLAKSSSSLVALLKQPAANLGKSKEVSSNVILDSLRNSRGSSVPMQRSDHVSERSTSVSPVVKIEVDEDMTHEIYSQSDSEVNGDKNRNPEIETAKDSNSTTKAPQGKLESRYPALFSHLQEAKQLYVDNREQTDSLVNRLPFISFQELFSQAPTGPQASGLTESATRQLLAQARINPYPSKENRKGPRKVWNWKKRQVRPRDADGKIISPVPVKLKHIKKTFAKRGVQSEKEKDKDWQPEADTVDIDSDNNDIASAIVDTESSTGRRTRLSCGEKPRINFAEIDNSDIEMDEEDVETSSATTQKQFIGNQPVFSDRQGEMSSIFPGGGSEQLLAAFSARSEQLNSASNSTSEQYKCSLCGLEFNQEYRWHYHLIKVHGITADKVNLFR